MKTCSWILERLKHSVAEFGLSNAGSVTTTLALTAVPFLGAAALAVDTSRAVSARQALQHVADASALAAAAALNAEETMRKQIASDFLNANTPALSGIEIATKNVVVGPNTIDVSLTADVKGTLLGVLMGKGSDAKYGEQGSGNSGDFDISVHSKVAFGRDSYLCLLSLNPKDYESVRFYGNSEFMADVCTVHANSNNVTAMRTQGSAYAQAEDFCAVGGWAGSGFVPDPTRGCSVKKDPYASLPRPTVGSCDHTNKTVKKNDAAALSPGVYCGGLTLEVHSTATFSPGIYIIKDGKLFIRSHSQLSAQGVMFFLTGTSSIEVESGAKIDLKAPSSGTYEGIAIMQHQNSNPGVTNVITSGGDVNIVGAFYTPSQQLRVWANGDMNGSSPYFPIVTDKFEMSGTATLHVRLDWEAAGYKEPVELKSPHYVLLTQ